MEWIKDSAEKCGWRRVTYEQGKPVQGEGHDGINVISGETFEMDENVGGL
jgi:hypothetical protein